MGASLSVKARCLARFVAYRCLSLYSSYLLAKNRLNFRMACMTLLSGEVQVGDCRCYVPIRVFGGNAALEVGDGVTLGWKSGPVFGDGSILLQPRGMNSQIKIGGDTVVGANSTFIAIQRIEIGENCLIGDRVTVFDSDFHDVNPLNRRVNRGAALPVRLGANVWVGSQCLILKGVSIGDNSVIGAGSVVSRSIPENCIACGNPARVVRHLD